MELLLKLKPAGKNGCDYIFESPCGMMIIDFIRGITETISGWNAKPIKWKHEV